MKKLQLIFLGVILAALLGLPAVVLPDSLQPPVDPVQIHLFEQIGVEALLLLR